MLWQQGEAEANHTTMSAAAHQAQCRGPVLAAAGGQIGDKDSSIHNRDANNGTKHPRSTNTSLRRDHLLPPLRLAPSRGSLAHTQQISKNRNCRRRALASPTPTNHGKRNYAADRLSNRLAPMRRASLQEIQRKADTAGCFWPKAMAKTNVPS